MRHDPYPKRNRGSPPSEPDAQARIPARRAHDRRQGLHRFSPWIADPEAVSSAMAMCTGSGCLSILMAHAFPNAKIVAVDISPDALDVARENIAAY